MDPCGTPNSIVDIWDIMPLTFVLWHRFDKYEVNQSVVALLFNILNNLESNSERSTVSNAFQHNVTHKMSKMSKKSSLCYQFLQMKGIKKLMHVLRIFSTGTSAIKVWYTSKQPPLSSNTIPRKGCEYKGLEGEYWRVEYYTQYYSSWVIQGPSNSPAHWPLEVSRPFHFCPHEVKTLPDWSVQLAELEFHVTSSPAAPITHCAVGHFSAFPSGILLILIDWLLCNRWTEGWIDKYKHGHGGTDEWVVELLWSCCILLSKLRCKRVCMPSIMDTIKSQSTHKFLAICHQFFSKIEVCLKSYQIINIKYNSRGISGMVFVSCLPGPSPTRAYGPYVDALAATQWCPIAFYISMSLSIMEISA